MIKQYITPALTIALLSGCSMTGPVAPDAASVGIPSGKIQSVTSFSELDCQPLPSGKSAFDTIIGSTSSHITLPTGESPVLAYHLPETGLHQITLLSRVVSNNKGTEELFFPEVSLFDRNGRTLRTIKGDQVKYQKPGFMAEEGVTTTFTIDNSTQNPAVCMAIYTSDKAREGKTKLINEAKEYAKVRGTVALPYPDSYAQHGNNGKLHITLKSNPEFAQLRFEPPAVMSSGATALSETDPFTNKVKKHYLKEVSDNLKSGNVTQALDQRSELSHVVKATETYFAIHYQQQGKKVENAGSAKKNNGFAAQAANHYQEKIATYFKQGKGSLALKVVDEIRAVQDQVDQLFDKKS